MEISRDTKAGDEEGTARERENEGLTNDPKDGAKGWAEKEEDDGDTDEESFQLTGLVGVGSDPDTLWGDPVNEVHSSDRKGDAEQQQEVGDPVCFSYTYTAMSVVE